MSALKPRPGIMEIAPYVPGEANIDGRDQVIRLASNENALGPSPAAVAAYQADADALHRYPDGAQKALRSAIATQYDLDPERIVCGAGSDELISLLVRAYAGPGDEVLYSAHGFLMYAISALTVGAAPVSVPERDLAADVDAMLDAVTEKTRIVFLANPNNPTGSYLPDSEVRRLREGLREDVLLVIDAAYAEYVDVDDYEPGIDLVQDFDNVVMTRTFSKIYGLAALRLGWAYCPSEIAGVLNRLRGPFNVSAAALDAGIAAVGDQDFVEHSRRHNARVRDWFVTKASALGLEPSPSQGNFVLLRFAGRDNKAAEAAAAFLKQRGILVRGVAAYGLPDCLRITIGTEDDMKAVIEGLGEFWA